MFLRKGMATYTNIVSTLAIWVADPLVSLRCFPRVLLLEEAEGKIYEGEDLEDGGDYESVDVDGNPDRWNLRGDFVEDADIQESLVWAVVWAGEFKLNVS